MAIAPLSAENSQWLELYRTFSRRMLLKRFDIHGISHGRGGVGVGGVENPGGAEPISRPRTGSTVRPDAFVGSECV